MHPVGQAWVDDHPEVVEDDSPQPCQACHGADYRGTVLSRAQAERVLHTPFGTKHFWQGMQIGCFTCHRGPFDDDANANRPPVALDDSAETRAGDLIVIQLSVLDADGDPVTMRVVSPPEHGSLELDGLVATYFPFPDFTGIDVFTFAAWDGSADSNLATVTLHIAGAMDACAGDCSRDSVVTVDELVMCVGRALGGADTTCPPCDVGGDGTVTVDELVQSVAAALNGCNQATATPQAHATATPTPSPTPTRSASLTIADVQPIFTDSCADTFCHSGAFPAGGLSLAAGTSYAALVGVGSTNPAARAAGLLRVNPGDPDRSFLIIKVTAPSPAEGALMPLGKAALTAEQIQLLRDWIMQGALP